MHYGDYEKRLEEVGTNTTTETAGLLVPEWAAAYDWSAQSGEATAFQAETDISGAPAQLPQYAQT